MIKFTGEGENGTKMIGLGLSRRNCELFLQDRPIKVALKDMGLPWDGEILLFAGETEQAIIQTLREGGIELPPAQTHNDDEQQEPCDGPEEPDEAL